MLSRCAVYYEHAKVFGDAVVLDMVVNCCSKYYAVLDQNSPIVKVAEPHFWLSVVQSKYFTNEDSKASIFISEICNATSDMGQELFRELTNAERLPTIHHSAVVSLLEAESRIVGLNPTTLSCLQERCIGVLVEYWEILEQEETISCLQKQSPSLLTQLMARIVSKARAEEGQLRRFKPLPTAALPKKIPKKWPLVVDADEDVHSPVDDHTDFVFYMVGREYDGHTPVQYRSAVY